jgi:HAD superfamily hydrolase (TIGR01549 family)
MSSQTPFRAFVFDLDGTLVDSKIDFAAMKAALEIDEETDVLKHIAGLPISSQPNALDIVARFEREGALDSTRIEGALEFVEQAREIGAPCAIFTRNSRELAIECLASHGFDIEFVIAREDAPPKPKPDGLLKIAREFNVQLNEVLFVGDYIYDLQAGLAAGTPTALFLPAPPDFDTTGAHYIFDSYEKLAAKIRM